MKTNDIYSPQDIKRFSIEELEELVRQIRLSIRPRTSSIGGSISPNLGVMEALTAMHYSFDPFHDKIVIDVPHQDFPHKTLTGRGYSFLSDDRYRRMNEQPDPLLCPEYDLFYASHTAPALSLCIDLARARQTARADYNIVAFVGDGSLCGGDAFESLDCGSDVKGSLVVIFNDTLTSFAPCSGGMHAKLQQLRDTHGTAPDNIFKAFGWGYFYVEDGNDIGMCISAMEKAREMNGPVLVHVNTHNCAISVQGEPTAETMLWPSPFAAAVEEKEIV